MWQSIFQRISTLYNLGNIAQQTYDQTKAQYESLKQMFRI